MKHDPLVSVVISNYNYARFLPACLDSVFGQSYRNLEVIVVDDGSSDNSRAVLAGYREVRTIFQQNGGQASAISRGVAESTGAVVCFLDSDDGWESGKVGRVVDVLCNHSSVGWVRHKARMVDEALNPIDSVAPIFSGSGIVPAHPALFLERIINSQPSCLAISRDVADKVFPLVITPELSFDADDAVLLARVFATGADGYSIDEVLGFYRRHAGERFGAHDIPTLLRREAAVTEALPRVFGLSAVPSAAYKLRAILAAMEGAHPWDARRWRPLIRGLVAAASLRKYPKLMTRQAAALMLAYAAPNFWLRRLARSQSWPPVQ